MKCRKITEHTLVKKILGVKTETGKKISLDIRVIIKIHSGDNFKSFNLKVAQAKKFLENDSIIIY